MGRWFAQAVPAQIVNAAPVSSVRAIRAHAADVQAANCRKPRNPFQPRTKQRKTLPPAIPALRMLPRIRDAGMRSARAPVADAAPGVRVELKSTASTCLVDINC